MARRDSVHKQIVSRRAPKPVGPYVHAIKVENPGATLYVSGQIPIELPSGNVFTGDIKRQAELALTHLRSIVQDSGFSMDEVVKCTVFLTNMDDFGAINEVYQKFFTGQALPARAARNSVSQGAFRNSHAYTSEPLLFSTIGYIGGQN